MNLPVTYRIVKMDDGRRVGAYFDADDNAVGFKEMADELNRLMSLQDVVGRLVKAEGDWQRSACVDDSPAGDSLRYATGAVVDVAAALCGYELHMDGWRKKEGE